MFFKIKLLGATILGKFFRKYRNLDLDLLLKEISFHRK